MNTRDIAGLALLLSVIVLSSLAIANKYNKGPEKPVVHHMKEGFICITYRETMICGQGTNTHPSKKGTNRDETLSVTYSILQVPSYSTEF